MKKISIFLSFFLCFFSLNTIANTNVFPDKEIIESSSLNNDINHLLPELCYRNFVLECPPGSYGYGSWFTQMYNCETGEIVGGYWWYLGCEDLPGESGDPLP